MAHWLVPGTLVTLSFLFIAAIDCSSGTTKAEVIDLPPPALSGPESVEACIASRRTVRSFASRPLDRGQVSQLLWASQGVTGEEPWQRAAPSGGGLHPLDVYLVVGAGGIEGVEAGVYRYIPAGHGMVRVASGDKRAPLSEACLGQAWLAGAPAAVVITSENSRITAKYGNRGVRYAWIEAGCVAENLFLQAEATGLGTGIIGAFDDNVVARVISALPRHEPLLVMPVGYRN
ncbi:SagB/ThcOx family dehydrogenase [Thermodesulfobacteriota bacterium]